MDKLPKYFVVKQNRNNPLWQKYINWLNKTYRAANVGNSYEYYGYENGERQGGTNCYDEISDFKNNPTLLTLKEWDSIVNSKTLQVGEKISICKYDFHIKEYNKQYYLNCNSIQNDRIFELLKLDKRKVCKEVLGYLPDFNSFPLCKTLEDLTKLVNYLKEVEMKQQEIPSIDLSEGWVVKCDNSEETNSVKNYLALKYRKQNGVKFNHYLHVIDTGAYGNNNYTTIPSAYKNLPILTFQQFELLILNKNKQDGNKNINEEIGSLETRQSIERGSAIRVPSEKGQIAIGSRPIGNKVTARIQKTTIITTKISSSVITC